MSVFGCTSREDIGRPDQDPGPGRPDQDPRPDVILIPPWHQVLQRDYETFKSSISAWQSTWEQKINSLVQTVEVLKGETAELSDASLAEATETCHTDVMEQPETATGEPVLTSRWKKILVEASMIQQVKTGFANLESQLGNAPPTSAPENLRATADCEDQEQIMNNIMKMIRTVYEDDLDRSVAASHMPQQQELQEKCNSLQVAQEKLAAQIEGLMQQTSAESTPRSQRFLGFPGCPRIRSWQPQQHGGDTPPSVGSNQEDRTAKLEALVANLSVGRHQEEQIAKIGALVDKLHCEVSELKGNGPDEARHVASMLIPVDKDRAPESNNPIESMTSSDAQVDFFYALHESTWDVPIIIGEPAVGRAASIYIVLIVLLNILVQLVLCCIINDVFTTQDISEEDAIRMKYWRVRFGHSMRSMNEFTHEPYAREVCRGVGGIQMLTEAVDLVQRIEEYMPTKEGYDSLDPFAGHMLEYTEHIGLLLSLCAVLIWTLEIIAVLMTVRSKISAIYHLPGGERSSLVDVGSERQVKRMWTGRKVLCLSSAAIEFLILLLLGMCGVFFIIRTIDLRDLLLNCSALIIVLEFDELVFAALVPQRSVYLLKSIAPLPRPAPPRCLGMTPATYVAMIIIIVSMAGSIFVLKQQASVLEQVHHEICGGNLDFVASPDRAGVAIASGLDTEPDEIDHVSKTYEFDAIRQLVLNEGGNVVSHRLSKGDMSAYSSGIDGGPWSVKAWTTVSVSAAMGFWNRKCVDMLPISNGEYDYANQFLHILRDTVGNYDIHDCTHAKKWCNEDSVMGERSRQVCPATCGCNDPGSRLLLLGDNGCPLTCTLTPEYEQSLWSRNCTDLDVESSYWPQYAESLRSYLMPSTIAGGFNMTAETAVIAANGCNIVSKAMDISVVGIRWADPCKVSAENLKPLTYACPVSCKCRSDNPLPFCPKRCT